LRSVNAVGYRT